MNYESHQLYPDVKEGILSELDVVTIFLNFPSDFKWDDRIIQYAIEDVFEASAIADEGFFSSDDITLGCQRALANFLNSD